MLSGRNITKKYGRQTALSNVSIDLDSSESVAVIGPSGCGKTTLLRCLARLERPDNGTVSLNGNAVKSVATLEAIPGFHPTVGYVSQERSLWPHLSIAKNLSLAQQLLRRNADVSYANRLIDVFGLTPILEKFPRQCSGGERQRVALVRALVLEPKYLLLDEVTSALDVEQIANVMETLRNLLNTGTGLLLVTHSLDIARAIANRFVFMDAGEIIEAGDISSLASPRTDRLKAFMSSATFQARRQVAGTA